MAGKVLAAALAGGVLIAADIVESAELVRGVDSAGVVDDQRDARRDDRLEGWSSASGTQSGPITALGFWLSAVWMSFAASGPRLS